MAFPDRMELPSTTMSGNVLTVWVLILLSTDHFISVRVDLLMQHT